MKIPFYFLAVFAGFFIFTSLSLKEVYGQALSAVYIKPNPAPANTSRGATLTATTTDACSSLGSANPGIGGGLVAGTCLFSGGDVCNSATSPDGSIRPCWWQWTCDTGAPGNYKASFSIYVSGGGAACPASTSYTINPTPTSTPTPTPTPPPPSTTSSTACGIDITNPRVTGLVTTPSLDPTSKFYTSSGGKCIVSSQTPFVPYKIPTYADLKSIFYDQSKSTAKVSMPLAFLPSIFRTDGIYVTSGDLTINSFSSGEGTQIVFVEGDLTFSNNYTYGPGTVFVVKGSVNINQAVTQINAVIISSGTICTAYDSVNSVCPSSNVNTSQLVINGSLISLDPTKPIQFKRALSDNTTAAEVINHQPKYLVILRNLFSQTYQKWSEVTQ